MTTGLQAQIGFADEATPGTPVTPDTFHGGFLSESIKQEIEQLLSAGLRAGRFTRACRKLGSRSITGSIEFELFHTPLLLLLEHMLGGEPVTTGAGPYTHTVQAGSLVGKALTVQVGRPADTGTVHPFTYSGVKINSWTIGAEVDDLAKLTLEVVGQTETTGTALATASYPDACPFVFTEASLTIGGDAIASVKSLELTGTNTVEGRIRLGSGFSTEVVENGWREYGGTITADFSDLVNYNRFVTGEEAALVVTFSDGTNSLVITENIYFTGETPAVAGPEMLEQSLPFGVVSSESDQAALEFVLINGESGA